MRENGWEDFVQLLWVAEKQKSPGAAKLPGFPIWVDAWADVATLDYDPRMPGWKANFLRKNAEFYTKHKQILDAWHARHRVYEFPPSRRKLEWQAQDAKSLWDCVLQFRPSGIRAKRPTHLPALVAITQTSIIGPLRRRLTPSEAARLQGLPRNFDFGDQTDAQTYRQLGNGVSVGAVWHVLKRHVERDARILESTEEGRAILKAIIDDAAKTPDDVLPAALARGQQRYADRVARLKVP